MEEKTFPDPRTEYIQTDINLRDLAKQWKLSQTAMSSRSKKENWVTQRKQFKIKTWAKSDEKAAETIADMNTRHLKQFKHLQDKALKTIQNKRKFEKDRDAVTALVEGVKGERTIRGEPTERQEVNITFEIKEV